jgi:phospholipase/lecithinase/hemolysin
MNQLSNALAGATLALVTLWTLPSGAANLNFKSIYSFGDSLSDRGNFFTVSEKLTGNGFPPSPFFNGRFSNGKVWGEYLAQDLGIEQKTFATLPLDSQLSKKGGVNFAFGGATTGTKNLGGQPFWGLEQQVDAFVDSLDDKPANSKALYTLWAGSNDYLDLLSSSPSPSQIDRQPFETVNNLSESITELANAGARNILVFNQPNLSKTPLGASSEQTATVLDLLSSTHNALLEVEIARLQQSLPKTNLILFDVDALLNEIVSAPGEFGLTNVTTSCNNSNLYQNPPYIDPNVCSNPDSYLFWDSVHPTTVGHQAIADSVLATLQSAFKPHQQETLSAFAPQLTAKSPATFRSNPVSVPEPSAVSAIGLVALGFLARSARRNSTR